jgi:hypothetical protein
VLHLTCRAHQQPAGISLLNVLELRSPSARSRHRTGLFQTGIGP